MRRRTLGLPFLALSIAACSMPAGLAQFMTSGQPLLGGQPDAGGRRYESEVEASPPTMHPLTEEHHVVTSRGSNPSGSDAPKLPARAGETNAAAASFDHHVKRSGFVQLRTSRIHPQPNLRHASGEYEGRPVPNSVAEVRIRDTLSMPLKHVFDFQETPLRAVMSQLREECDIPVMPDLQALTDAGIDLDETTVTQVFHLGMTLRSALRHMLRKPGLTYLVKDDALLVTTREKADEHLQLMLYTIPGSCDPGAVVDLIQGTVAEPTWDTVGGPGAIQIVDDAAILAISQTEEVHDQIAAVLQALDGDLGSPDPGVKADPDAMPTRVYPIRDDKTLQELQKNLVSLCNDALGAAGDSKAKVSVVAGKLVVQSGKRGFHVYAGEMIRAFNGIDVSTSEYLGVSGDSAVPAGGQNGIDSGVFGGGASFCWVAREVYGADDPRWLVFRGWMLTEAPASLRDVYGAFGPDVAAWIHGRPAAKAALRFLMNTVVDPRLP